jgi:hypothetical protein
MVKREIFEYKNPMIPQSVIDDLGIGVLVYGDNINKGKILTDEQCRKIQDEVLYFIMDNIEPIFTRKLIQEDFPLLVEHETSGWVKTFLREGVDTGIPPPDVRLGRGTYKSGFRMIFTKGLFVNPLTVYKIQFMPYEGIRFIVKPSELSPSIEVMDYWYDKPKAAQYPKELAMYGLAIGDGLVTGMIPRNRIWQAWYINEKIYENKDIILEELRGEYGVSVRTDIEEM